MVIDLLLYDSGCGSVGAIAGLCGVAKEWIFWNVCEKEKRFVICDVLFVQKRSFFAIRGKSNDMAFRQIQVDLVS